MDEIKTKYIGPKGNVGGRIRAWCRRGSITVPYPYSLGTSERHEYAANKLREKLTKKDGARGENAIVALAQAARSVINNWSTGDLAAAVRQLDMALDDYDNAKGKAK